MSLADKLKTKTPIHWFEIRGEKVGVRQLTIGEFKEYAKKLSETDDEETMAEIMSEYILDESEAKAFTVQEMEEVLTSDELIEIVKQFNAANNLQSEGESGN